MRKKRKGRKERPLSSKAPIHLVFKANRETIRGGFRTPRRFRLIHNLTARYAKRFFVKIEQISIQGDHIHLVVRMARRSQFQNFLRVFAGQTAQQFKLEDLISTVEPSRAYRASNATGTPASAKADVERRSTIAQKIEKLWKHRPYTRVVLGRKAYVTLQNYVQLNEQEALGKIPYRKERLRGLEPDDWDILWR